MPKAKSKTVYFVGIGGASLNGIAQVLAARGFTVRGSDIAVSPVTEHLESLGIKVIIGQKGANITADIDEVVISSAVVAGPGAVEVEAAKKLKIPVFKRTIWWRRLMSESKQAVAVAGTHGKTSTTAMIGHILAVAGLDPTVLVGGEVPDFNGTVRVGGKDCVVVEADEYDHAFYACRPTVAVITTVDYDHPDTYPTREAYVRAFMRFARLVRRRKGLIVANGEDKTLRMELKNWSLPIRWYMSKNIWPGLKLKTPGAHLLMNATAAAKVAHELGIDKKTINRALRSWKGVSRRFEFIGERKSMKIYDDYAHHPTEIEANITTTHTLTDKKVAVLFQPHQRVRTKKFLEDFVTVLNKADKIGVMPLFEVAGREEKIDIASDDIVRKLHKKCELVNEEKINDFINSLGDEYGLLLIMGAGSISSSVRKVLNQNEKT